MGADFVYATCHVPHAAFTKNIDEGSPTMKHLIVNRIIEGLRDGHIDPYDVHEAAKQAEYREVAGVDASMIDNLDCAHITDEQLAVITAYGNDLAERFADIVESRETGVLTLGGSEDPTVFYISGGMSWGDDPTDAYPVINELDYLAVFDKPITAEEWDRAATQAANSTPAVAPVS